MTQYNRFMGEYDPEFEYQRGDVVTFEGAAYHRKSAGKGISPIAMKKPYAVWGRMNDDLSTVFQLGGSAEQVQAEQVQADWNESDPESMAYIKNKPFGSTLVQSNGSLTVEITAEEMQELADSGALVGGVFYKIANNVITTSDLDNGYKVYAYDSLMVEVPAGEAASTITSVADGVIIFADAFASVDEQAVGVDLDGASFPEKGLYLMGAAWPDGVNISLEIPDCIFIYYGETTKIPSRYLPKLNYLNTVDPVGSGSFSMNRKDGTTIGSRSHAEGSDTTASGDYSHAEGWGSTASDSSSHAEGWGSTASGSSSHAEGSHTSAQGVASHTEGSYTSARGTTSHAEGHECHASGDYSHAEGYFTYASADHQHVQGKYNIEDLNDVYAHIVGNGESDNARSNAHTLDWSGNAWFAGTVEGTAIILSSPNGSRWKITVDDIGTLVTAKV